MSEVPFWHFHTAVSSLSTPLLRDGVHHLRPPWLQVNRRTGSGVLGALQEGRRILDAVRLRFLGPPKEIVCSTNV